MRISAMEPRRSARILPASSTRLAPRADAFDDHCDALTHSDAHGAEGVTAAAALELIDRGGCEARAAGAERMAERDRAALGIHMGGIVRDLELAQHGERLGRECLVELDQVHLVERQSETSQ